MSLVLFASTEFLLSLSPGPAVLLVMSQALRSGAKASLLGALGIITGNAVYFAISALGLGAILIASDVLFYLIKWTGATYLVYLGNVRGTCKNRSQDANDWKTIDCNGALFYPWRR
jgi:threonine/homoserine/homoserine lactone efflux protein